MSCCPWLAPPYRGRRTGRRLADLEIVLVVEFLGRSNGVGFKIHLLFSSFDVEGVLAWSLAFVGVMRWPSTSGCLRP